MKSNVWQLFSKAVHNKGGAHAKAKANASQGIMEMLEIATEKRFRENHKELVCLSIMRRMGNCTCMI